MNMTNYVIRLIFQFPLMWVLWGSLESAYDMNLWKAGLITLGLTFLYDMGEYIARKN